MLDSSSPGLAQRVTHTHMHHTHTLLILQRVYKVYKYTIHERLLLQHPEVSRHRQGYFQAHNERPIAVGSKCKGHFVQGLSLNKTQRKLEESLLCPLYCGKWRARCCNVFNAFASILSVIVQVAFAPALHHFPNVHFVLLQIDRRFQHGIQYDTISYNINSAEYQTFMRWLSTSSPWRTRTGISIMNHECDLPALGHVFWNRIGTLVLWYTTHVRRNDMKWLCKCKLSLLLFFLSSSLLFPVTPSLAAHLKTGTCTSSCRQHVRDSCSVSQCISQFPLWVYRFCRFVQKVFPPFCSLWVLHRIKLLHPLTPPSFPTNTLLHQQFFHHQAFAPTCVSNNTVLHHLLFTPISFSTKKLFWPSFYTTKLLHTHAFTIFYMEAINNGE